MTVLTRAPQNTNYLQPSKFLLSFDRMPTVQYFCQEVNLPGVSMGQAKQSIETIAAFVKEKFPMLGGAVNQIFKAGGK